ncbi:MAG: HlyD family secretion protein, partial [Candidatus Faecalibacterium intestinavium]|nr:HlyD family secretion protein [Candidatus Faecalibacterium intestinavium]
MLHRKKSSAPAEQEPAVQIGAPPRRPTLLLFLRSHWKALAAGGCLLAAAAALAVPWVLPRPAEKTAGLTEVLPVRREITRTLTSSGVLSAANSYSVTALTPGVVLSAAFEVGDSVEKGQVLYQIDSDAAVAGVETARLALEQAQRSYDEAAAAAEVRAPAGGTLVSYAVRAGDAVQPGQE